MSIAHMCGVEGAQCVGHTALPVKLRRRRRALSSPSYNTFSVLYCEVEVEVATRTWRQYEPRKARILRDFYFPLQVSFSSANFRENGTVAQHGRQGCTLHGGG